MAESTTSVSYLKEKIFRFKLKIFGDDGNLLQTDYNFSTTEGLEFSYLWRIKYTIHSDPRSRYADHHETDHLHCNKFILSKIKVDSLKDLKVGDSAIVNVYINQTIYLKAKFDSKSSLPWVKKVKPELKINKLKHNPQILIKIRITHQDKSIDYMIENYNRFLCLFFDVSFTVEEKRFLAHRKILASRSPVFAAMFESDMLEKTNGVVEITDIKPNIFEHLLNFIYWGKVSLINVFQDFLDLMVAADKYSITSLVRTCEGYVFKGLQTENVIDAVVIADLINAKVLKNDCIEFIFKNKRKVIQTESYKNFINSRTKLGNEILNQILEKF